MSGEGTGTSRRAPCPRWRGLSRLLLALALPVACAPPSPSPSRAAEPAAVWLEECTEELGFPEPRLDWPDGRYHPPEVMGAGVALFDADGDGDLDLLQLRVPPPGRPGAPAPNVLWMQGPDGRFSEAGAALGPADPGFAQGLALGDADGDGDLDVYFANSGADAYYRNLGGGRFEEATAAAGFEDAAWSSAAAFCDHDLDGDLDLYVVRYLRVERELECLGPSGARDYCSPAAFDGLDDALWVNDGSGRFEERGRELGIAGTGAGRRAKGLGVACLDLTADGRPDYYVANDRENNQLWAGTAEGGFRDEALVRGLAVNAMGQPEASMGLAVGDADGDGRLDLLATHFAGESNTLYLAGPHGGWRDGTYRSGLGRADLPFTGFGCALADLDLDGDPDLLVANGRVLRGAQAEGAAGNAFWQRYAEPNLIYVNEGGRFERRDELAPGFTGRLEVTRGLATGDLDGDGDLDVVTSNVDGGVRVYRNRTESLGNRGLRIRALDEGRDALGAELRVQVAGRTVTVPVLSAVSYQSASEAVATVGLGTAPRPDSLEVRWPGGAVERHDVPALGPEIQLHRGKGTPP